MPKTEKELFQTLYQMNRQRMADYQRGFADGYAKKEKELMEQAEAEQKTIDKAEDYRQQ